MKLPRRACLGAAALLVLAAGAPSLADTVALPLDLAEPAVQQPTPVPLPVAAPAGYRAIASWQLLAKVNSYRRSRGLAALRVDPALATIARSWTEGMTARDALAHNEPMFTTASHRRLGMRLLGENVAWNVSVAAQHEALLASPHHRANIVNPAFRLAGFAVVRDSSGRLWVTEDFGTARS